MCAYASHNGLPTVLTHTLFCADSRLSASLSHLKERSLSEARAKRAQQREALGYSSTMRRLELKKEQVAKAQVRLVWRYW